MADKKNPEFTVTDRRHFTPEGEARSDVPVKNEPEAAQAPAEPPSAHREDESAELPLGNVPEAPTAAEQQAQKDAFDASAKEMDARLKTEMDLRGRSMKEFEVSFERFIASLYMSALMQLGLMHEQGGTPRVDLVGGRQTIDTIAMIADKTKGNLTPAEENLLQNCLYELRMAYVEVTNAVNRAALQQPPGGPLK